MPTNRKEYMREYQRQRRALLRGEIAEIKVKKIKKNINKEDNIEINFIIKLIIKATARRTITIEESEQAIKFLNKIKTGD